MPSQSLAKFYALANRSKETLRRYREKEKESTNDLVQRAGCAAAGLGGLCLAGFVDGKWGYDGKAGYASAPAEVNGIACVGPVPINAALGIVAIVAGVPGIVPGSEYLTSLGTSLLGYPLAKTIEAKVQEKQKA